MTKVDLAGRVGATADAAVSSSAGVALTVTLGLAISPCPPQSGAGEMDVPAFILVPRGSAAFGFHPDQHGPTGQKLSLAGLHLPLL